MSYSPTYGVTPDPLNCKMAALHAFRQVSLTAFQRSVVFAQTRSDWRRDLHLAVSQPHPNFNKHQEHGTHQAAVSVSTSGSQEAEVSGWGCSWSGAPLLLCPPLGGAVYSRERQWWSIFWCVGCVPRQAAEKEPTESANQKHPRAGHMKSYQVRPTQPLQNRGVY